MSTSQSPVSRQISSRGGRFLSLRTKFVLFFSLILIVTCSTLSWYFIESRRTSMTDNLYRLGTILLTSVVNNGQFRYGGLIAEDQATLDQFTESLMAVDDVVYVVIRGTDQEILAQQNKLGRGAPRVPMLAQERQFYPDESIARQLYRQPVSSPQITPVAVSRDKILVPAVTATSWLWLSDPSAENLYDFALPVLRRQESEPSFSPLPFELDEAHAPGGRSKRELVQGVVQIGITDAKVKQAVIDMIRNVMLLTTLLIGAGIFGAHLLTLRITTPLRSLAAVARQLAEGGSPEPLTPATQDEVGQLTRMFNLMTQALHERNLAVTTSMDTIRRQIGQLTTVHQTSAAITGTLDLHQLMDTVLQLLIANLGFTRMLLMLRHEDRDLAYVAQLAGVSDEIADAARYLTVPIKEDGTLLSELFIHAKPVLVHDINTAAHRMHPSILELTRREGVSSFVCVPLQSHNQTLGFLGGDRGAQSCSQEDLEILLTIASHVATAIDNARTYANLSQLTQTLEYRIQQRTQELSLVNERLQEQDRKRTMFISVASHELRTPMTAIRSFADNMLDGVAGALTERQTTYLNRIGHNLNRLTRIINQLLDWSRLDLKREVLRLEPLCIRQISTLVVESLRTIAQEKNVSIEIEAPDEMPSIQADRDKLEQILWNLIGNAVKFTRAGGRVTIGFESLPDETVQVCVADTGCGIPPEHLHRIFDEFSKVPSAMPTSQGAQLGLFITKSFVTMHNGRIWAESTPDVGTRFSFTIPCASGQDSAGEAEPRTTTENP
jgi:two-component system, sensor histidine kinase and response regulator